MSKTIQRKNIKIRTLSDLKLAKEIYNYEAKLHEQSLISGLNNFNGLLLASLKSTLVLYGQKVLVSTLHRLLKYKS